MIGGINNMECVFYDSVFYSDINCKECPLHKMCDCDTPIAIEIINATKQCVDVVEQKWQEKMENEM